MNVKSKERLRDRLQLTSINIQLLQAEHKPTDRPRCLTVLVLLH